MAGVEKTNKNKIKRPFFAWALIVLMLFLGVAAIISGPMLFLAPDGRFMGMPTSLLAGSPFSDFLLPGIILFLFVGVFPFIVGIGLIKTSWKGLWFLNPFKHHHWAWTGSLAAGIVLLIWVSVETILLGYISFLQPLMGAWGLILIILAVLPPVRRFYTKVK
jgi:hypothetical protein